MRGKRLVARCGLLSAVALATSGVGSIAPSASAQDSRIVGGTTVTHDNYKFMTSLRDRWGSHFCGGTLIKANWVLTASHCVSGKNAKSISVVVGQKKLNGTDGYRSKVNRILMHPSYGKPVRYAHDAALLELTTAIPSAVTPIRVAPRDPDWELEDGYELPGNQLTVAGWGTLTEGGSCCPNDLQEVDVPVVSDADCTIAYGSSMHAESMLCAGMFGKDSCQGDSGGPLFDNTDYVQLGTVSWGQGCARKEYPGVYGELNMPAIRDWITSNAGV